MVHKLRVRVAQMLNQGPYNYLPYRYVLPQTVWFLLHFGLKTGVDFAYFGLNLGIVFEGKWEGINVLILLFQFQMNKKE